MEKDKGVTKMKEWFAKRDYTTKVLIIGLAIYAAMYITVSIIESALGIHI